MNNKTCSILIRCYNEERHIGRLLSGIVQQSITDTEIILVDSGSTDATLTIASRYPVKIVHISPEEFSFGRALNMGCEVATRDFIVLASAHVYPLYKDWLENLLAFFTSDRVALVYGKQRGNELSKFSEHQVFAQWFPSVSNRSQSHPFCNNANAAIRRSVWEKILYDESLTGLEDLDWAKRALAQHYRIAYSADTEIVHVHEESFAHILNRYRREALALKQIMPDEQFTFFDFMRLFVSNCSNDLLKARHEGILRRELRSICAFRFMQFWGTYRGFTQKGPVSASLRQRFYYPSDWRTSSSTVCTDPSRCIDYSNQ
jgi:glycosyltransferase involved in cell wall biosynthesis